jgi:hypothetical protein
MRWRDALVWVPKLLAGWLFLTMLLASFLLALKPWLSDAVPWLYSGLAPELVGVQSRGEPPVLSASRVLDRRFQQALEAWVGDNVPHRPLLVRGFNEALWRAFRTSFMSNGRIIAGRQDTLFEESYILDHCGLARATDMRELPNFVRRLRPVQDWFTARGQLFLYMLAPVKTNWSPERIPSAYPCPAADRDRTYRHASALFKSAGVNFVDARAALETMRSKTPVELYPRTGIHWNWLGAALAANALVEKARALGLADVPLLSYDVSVAPDELPGSIDRDLANLLNLLSAPRGASSPVLRTRPGENGPARCSLVAVNDSFMLQPGFLLQEGGVFRSVEVNSYFYMARRRFPDWTPMAVDPDAPGAYAALFAADVVVLEEIESRIGAPFATMFLGLVEREMARGGAVTGTTPMRCGGSVTSSGDASDRMVR